MADTNHDGVDESTVSDYHGFDSRKYLISLFLLTNDSMMELKIKLIRAPKSAKASFHHGFYRRFSTLYGLTKDAFEDDRKADPEIDTLLKSIEAWDRYVEATPQHKITLQVMRAGINFYAKYVPLLRRKSIVKVI